MLWLWSIEAMIDLNGVLKFSLGVDQLSFEMDGQHSVGPRFKLYTVKQYASWATG